jgi:hypothetical protein
MWMPQCVLRAMAEPTVLVTPTHSAPQALAYSRARKVSAVSPDCGEAGRHAGSVSTTPATKPAKWIPRFALPANSPRQRLVGAAQPRPGRHQPGSMSSTHAASQHRSTPPTWDTKMQVSSRKMGQRRSSRSEASSRTTGISVSSSTVWRQATAAWKLVPHAMNIRRRERRIVCRGGDRRGKQPQARHRTASMQTLKAGKR